MTSLSVGQHRFVPLTASIALMLVFASGTDATPTNGVTCEEYCSQGSVRLFEQCVDDQSEPEDCDRRATRFLDSCRRVECGLDSADPTCDRLCSIQTEEAIYECWLAGGLLELCTELVRSDFEACLEEQCEIQLPDPSCTTRCQTEAEVKLITCVEDGYDWKSCAYTALLEADACMAHECPPASVNAWGPASSEIPTLFPVP